MASNDTFPLEQEQRQQGGTSQETNGKHSLMTNEEDPSLLVRYEEVRGSRPGDVRARRVIPAHPKLRRVERGVLEATTAADAPQTGWERTTTALKRALIGTPLSTARLEHERLTKFKALAVLSSDVISSVAYATEAILLTLVVAGSGNLWVTLFICFAIVALLTIVALSYRQTIPAYPNGGGSYIVARENLGTLPGLVAAAALLIDYVLNVAVCISAGILNIVAIFPGFEPYMVPLDLALVLLMTILNLRGMRESGTIFAFPTYFFIVSSALLIIV